MIKKFKLIQFNEINKDLLVWVKRFLVLKLSELGKNKVDNSKIAIFTKCIEVSTDVEDIKSVAKELKKELGGFYNLTQGLIRFISFIEASKISSLTDINGNLFNDKFINGYIAKLSLSTKRDTKSAVGQLFEYIDFNNIHEGNEPYDFDITKDVDGKVILNNNIKQVKKPLVVLNDKELFKLKKDLLRCDDFVKANFEFQKAKEVLIMKILIYSGITSSELVNLKLEDINPEDKFIVLNIDNSANASRKIPIAKKFIEKDLHKYLEVREDIKEHDYLFYDKAKKESQLRQQYVLNTVKKFIHFSQIDKPKITVETIRNSYAISLFNAGKSVEFIQQQLGHSKLKTTKQLLPKAE